MDYPEDYVKRIVRVLIYIEDHIDEEISMEELARVACYSPFHFHRIFHMVAQETAHQYVKRLRLERAAMKLRYTDQPVTEIALDSQYDTPSAFTRAFKQALGESPRNYRILYKEVNAMTRKLTELPNITPETITRTSDLDLLFIRRLGKYTESASQAWVNMHAFIEEHHLNPAHLRYFGISHDDPRVTPEEKLRYDACILAPKNVQTQGKGEVSSQTLKGGKYAVFVHHGSYEGLNETFDRIFLKWMPTVKENFDDTRPVFEEYFHLEFVKTDPGKLLTKIYIPLA